MKGRKTPEEMAGESLREMGVLVVVFYGLSTFIKLEGLGLGQLAEATVASLAGISMWLIGTNLELRD